VAKQVRTHTEITRGAVSVGSVAVDLAEQIFGHFETRKVLLLGAGEASERTARALMKRGVRDIRVANRSRERAEALSALISGRAVSIEREVFPRLVGQGLYSRRLEGYWMDIGTPERYLQGTFEQLHGEDGIPHAALERVRCPIGLPLGGDTPEEIAVSIVAELLQIRHAAR
jgi:hypothetical protein